jgi:NAD-dependent deacetylase
MEFGYIGAFRRNPAKVWNMLLEMDHLLSSAQPNFAHLALARLEKREIIKAVITQNVDSLHQRAGSRTVVEYHGHNRTLRCDRCGSRVERGKIVLDNLPPLCACGEALRPDFVFFGEPIPEDAHSQAMEEARQCDLMLVIGTSATVAPASYIPIVAKERGAFLLEINPNATELTHRLTDLHIAEPAARALSAICSELNESKVL